MSQLGKAIIEAGLLDSNTINEIRKWGLPVPAASVLEDIAQDKDEVLAHIREALEGPDQVRMEETDLDLLTRYLSLKHQKRGRLILKEGSEHRTLVTTFCLTPLGEYAFPWTAADSPEILVNGESHLKWVAEDGTKHDVYFSTLREMHLGAVKMFVVCEVQNV